MSMIIRFLSGRFTGYTLILMLISAYVLIFRDTSLLKRKGLTRESNFAYIAGILYAVLGVAFYIIGSTMNKGR
jgi:hypothetical protein